MNYPIFKPGFSERSPWGPVEEGPNLAQRRERRSPFSFPIVVCGLDHNGRLFSELTSTIDVSCSGCLLHLITRPQIDSALAFRIAMKDGPAFADPAQLLFQIAWMRQENGGWTVGAYTLGKTNLLTLTFPSRAAFSAVTPPR